VDAVRYGWGGDARDQSDAESGADEPQACWPVGTANDTSGSAMPGQAPNSGDSPWLAPGHQGLAGQFLQLDPAPTVLATGRADNMFLCHPFLMHTACAWASLRPQAAMQSAW